MIPQRSVRYRIADAIRTMRGGVAPSRSPKTTVKNWDVFQASQAARSWPTASATVANPSRARASSNP